MTAATASEGAAAEAERQLAAAADRHREAVTSMEQPGRPEAGQFVAAKSVGRAVHLVAFALRHAADVGVPFDRLVELTGWERDLVREGLERPVPEPRVVARLAPERVDAGAVAEVGRPSCRIVQDAQLKNRPGEVLAHPSSKPPQHSIVPRYPSACTVRDTVWSFRPTPTGRRAQVGPR